MEKFEYPIDKGLIRALKKRFPVVLPSLDWDDRRIWYEVGKQELINFLERQWKEQNNDILTNNVLKEN